MRENLFGMWKDRLVPALAVVLVTTETRHQRLSYKVRMVVKGGQWNFTCRPLTSMHAGHRPSAFVGFEDAEGQRPSAPAPATKRTEGERVAMFVWHSDIPLWKGNNFYVKLWWIGPLHIEKGVETTSWWWWRSRFNVTGQRLTSGPSRLVGCFWSLERKLGEKWVGVHWCPCFLFSKMVVKGVIRVYLFFSHTASIFAI